MPLIQPHSTKRLRELSDILGGYSEQEALEAAYEMHEAAEVIEKLQQVLEEKERAPNPI